MPAPRNNQNARRHGAYSQRRRRVDAAHNSAAHGGGVETAPPKDTTSTPPTESKEPLPSLPDLILDLWHRQQDLAAWMKDNAQCEGDQNGHYMAAASLYGQNASRLVRMVRVAEGLGGGDKAQKLADALYSATVTVCEELGIEI